MPSASWQPGRPINSNTQLKLMETIPPTSPTEGGPPVQPPPNDRVPPSPPPPGPPPAEPPRTPPVVAKTALEGEKTERELRLERDLRNREVRISELEDEKRRLKTVPAPQPPPPTPARKKSEWLAGLPFYEED